MLREDSSGVILQLLCGLNAAASNKLYMLEGVTHILDKPKRETKERTWCARVKCNEKWNRVASPQYKLMDRASKTKCEREKGKV